MTRFPFIGEVTEVLDLQKRFEVINCKLLTRQGCLFFEELMKNENVCYKHSRKLIREKHRTRK